VISLHIITYILENKMIIEKTFTDKFTDKIGQVFMHLIDECNLHCAHCLYKPELTFQIGRKSIPFDECVELMINFKSLGASKISFLGGEPTLHPKLPELIHEARIIGYDYVRIVTNGQFDVNLLNNTYIRELDEITFSIDGYTEEINDALRGSGSFNNIVKNINRAVELKMNVHITTCIHKELVKMDGDKLKLIKMIEFAKSIGIKTINMHDLFKSGIPRDLWTGNFEPSIESFQMVLDCINNYKQKENEISIRMPQCIVSKKEFKNNIAYYSYCSIKQFDRILVFPNGMLRICSLMIGTPYCIGYYTKDEIFWNNTPTNELINHKMDKNTACTNQLKKN
jgi:molybdenum cofactor biosynthesis enzyme MoaA